MREHGRRHRLIGLIGLTLIALLILWVTMRPTTIDGDYGPVVQWVLARLHRAGVPSSFGFNELEFTANIIMFMPLGFFAGLLLGLRWLWAGVVILPMASVAVETTQLLFLPSRYATLPDVVANSLGGWCGLAFAMLLLFALELPRRGYAQPR